MPFCSIRINVGLHNVPYENVILLRGAIFLDRKYAISKLVKNVDDATIILNLDKNKLQEAYYRLKSAHKVAKEFGCCYNSIYNYIRKYNIKLL